MEVADNLHQLATDLWEKQQQNSENSSQPPSLDNPYSPKQKQEAEQPSSESGTIEQWILDDLRELIAIIASGSEDNHLTRKLLRGLRRVCHLGQKADHKKLQALG